MNWLAGPHYAVLWCDPYGILWHSKKALEDTGKICFDLPDSKPEQNKFQYKCHGLKVFFLSFFNSNRK